MWVFLFYLFAAQARAAPCCAGGSAVPALITGDESELYQAGMSYGTVIGDAPGADGGIPVFRDGLSIAEDRGILTLNHARILDGDRLQAGISIPIQFNQLSQGGRAEDSVQIGDVSVVLGFETIPEWEYSVWKPRVFSFLQAGIPTGRSIHESQSFFASDVSGLGQFQLSFGSIALKRWSKWDLNLLARGGSVMGRSFVNASGGGVILGSSFLGTGSLGAGFSPSERVRLGGAISVDYQSPVEVLDSNIYSITSERLVWNSNVSLMFMIGADDSLVLGYQDQTWFGPAYNTSLSRSGYLSFVHRVER
ncbi:MAG: hypothetical protein KGP28_08540 [Bdellovibrionales bacterium]|nr:hypothetical protein [Bdellovibrionales bacterium]